MTTRMHAAAACALLFAASAVFAAAPQPIDSFARRPQMRGLTISADGRYIAFLSGSGDDTVLMTFDRTQTGSAFKRVTASEPDKFDIGWCRWANEKRLLCGLYGNIRGKKYAEPPFKRVFAVDADGAALKVLEESRNDANLFGGKTSMRNFNLNSPDKTSTTVQGGHGDQNSFYGSAVSGNYIGSFRPERQDEVIDFTPDEHDTVLIQADDDRNSIPSIFRLNIYNGQRDVQINEKPPIQQFVTDGHGNPRLGWGASKNQETSYFAQLDGERAWRRLGATEAFGASIHFRPVTMAAATNSAYALGTFEGRDALWSIDLAEKRDPQLLFHHPLVDAGEPILQSDRRLLGIRYDVERPYVWYVDPKLRELIDRLESQFPGRVHDIVDSSADMNTFVIQASSDVDEGTYFLYDVDKNKLQKLGAAYPELDQQTLGTMTNVVYKASDGTEIPAYLTVPSGAERKNLPLIVMPHDGPVSRDTWKFSFLRTFLANRGYAVLQMNYRGSSGFGEKWRLGAHDDSGGLIYSDIQDATRWAIREGIADPKRVCILGWGFGGYEALLSAARNSEMYRCAVSIGGIADLEQQKEQADSLGTNQFSGEVASDREERRRDSPLENASSIGIPVLLVHGTKDWQVQVDQTKDMSDRLAKLKKPHTEVLIKGGGHDLERKSDRVTLLKELEAFLSQNLSTPST